MGLVGVYAANIDKFRVVERPCIIRLAAIGVVLPNAFGTAWPGKASCYRINAGQTGSGRSIAMG